MLFLLFLFQYIRFSLRAGRLREGHYHWNIQLGLLTGIVGFLVLVLVDTVLHNPQPVMTFWYLMGLQWAHHNIYAAEALS